MSLSPSAFIAKWQGSAGDERANKDSFLREFCEALGLDTPGPKDSSPDYCFEKEVQIPQADGSSNTKFMDLYRAGCFVLEAKQGGRTGMTYPRGTRSYDRYMERGFNQARAYAQALPKRPPFVLTCDIGHLFEVWEGFSGDYGGYARRRTIPLADLAKPEVQSFFQALWNDPKSLDPARRRARVTREVAETLGELAKALEARFGNGEAIARFLMRCVFTFFAEDAGLLPERSFQDALDRWRKEPRLFTKGLESLWDAMNQGGMWGRDAILHFNGGLFAESLALDLDAREIELLFQAARFNWEEVDPSIFGTLLESALDPKERHKLGAHYTPRAFVERLLRPALEDPLRADWEVAQAEALSHLSDQPTAEERAAARAVLHRFQRDLAHVTVLDPACGSGNFLAAAYDILKRLEGEVQRRLTDLGETAQALALEGEVVTPRQFKGIEVKPWAAAIADMVLWIGHLQWHRRLHPGHTPPEPVLQAYGNIERRDAVLAYRSTRDTGRTRWDGVTVKRHPVTGLEVPDEAAQVPIVELLDPRPAEWPRADFIIGNPPFLGNKRMREALGDGYAEALRAAYPEVPASVDFVLYWWHRAAEAVRKGEARRFGLITTNSLTQILSRRVVAQATNAKPALKLAFAIPDHPWHDQGAAVRIAMTVGTRTEDGTQPWLARVTHEGDGLTPEMEAEAVIVEGGAVERIHDDLRGGANIADVESLIANSGICFQGMILVGDGFRLTSQQVQQLGYRLDDLPPVIAPHMNAKDLVQGGAIRYVVDFFGMTQESARLAFPNLFQHLLDCVKPERDANRDKGFRERWWLFGRPRVDFRLSRNGLMRFIITPETSKHRVFAWTGASLCPDHKLYAICSDDAFILGVLSSRFQAVWALAAGGTLEDRPTWTNSTCFDPFPFPVATEVQQARIRDLAEQLDIHRKAAQGCGVTLTQMYNLLAKLRAGEAFTAKEQALHAQAQTSILRQLHDDLDAAVAEAYGWPADLSEAEILERLVALNRERAEEERRGLVRWLRPDYQAKQAPAETPELLPTAVAASPAATPAALPEARPWPTDRRAQFAALRDLLRGSARLWSLEDLAACFKSRGRYRDSIQAHLAVLEDLGLVDRLDTPEGPRWNRPTAVAG